MREAGRRRVHGPQPATHAPNDPFLYYIHVSVDAPSRFSGHAGRMGVRSVGVEEELLLVEPDTGRPQLGQTHPTVDVLTEVGHMAARA